MEKINPQASLGKFFHSFTESKHRILFLDYDGTLAGIRKERDKAFPYPGVVERLEILANSPNTRLIIISGRTLEDLKNLLKLKNYPEMVGSHGTEIFDPEKSDTEIKFDEKSRNGLLRVQMWAVESGLNYHAEIKLTGISFHWRGLSKEKQKEIRDKVTDKWKDEAGNYNLELHEFDGGIELRDANMNKGVAVDSIMSKETNGTITAYLGDDQTDEEAFEKLGNKALKVLVRTESRPTKADIHLVPPEELIEFLDRWIESDK